MSDAVPNVRIEELHKNPGTGSAGNTTFDPSKINCFTVMFYLLLSSMSINQSTVVTESKQINANAKVQDMLNSMNANVKFSLLSASAAQWSPQEFNEKNAALQAANEDHAAMRQTIQGFAITARQVGSVLSTQASANVDMMQQNSQIASGVLSMCNTIFQEIDQMSPGAGG